MNREYITQYSPCLNRDMHLLVYGHSGLGILVFPCQDAMCDNYENFGMIDTLKDYIESGQIQLFCVDTVDRESWSDVNGDKEHRAYMQEQYYYYIVNEVVPFIKNQYHVEKLITNGCSLGATHAAITFLRRPDLFDGVIALSGYYDAMHFWDGWCNSTLYYNSPVHFLAELPEDHPYIELYNQRKIILSIGQGAWQKEGIRTLNIIRDIFREKGIDGWLDFWGYDVDHDWPWWKKQMLYFLPYVLNDE